MSKDLAFFDTNIYIYAKRSGFVFALLGLSHVFFGSTTEAQVTSSSLVPYTLCAKRLVFPACFCVSLHTWYTLHLQRFLSCERRQDSVLEAEEEKGSYRPWHQKQTEEVSTSKIGNTTTILLHYP